MSLQLITKDQVLKAELDEMMEVRELQSKVREAPNEAITTDLGMSNMAKRLMLLGPMFTRQAQGRCPPLPGLSRPLRQALPVGDDAGEDDSARRPSERRRRR